MAKKENIKRLRTKKYEAQFKRTAENTIKRRERHLRANPNDKQARLIYKENTPAFTKGSVRAFVMPKGVSFNQAPPVKE